MICLPDRPFEGTGSLSDWMGSAGDLSREAASACSHAQLRAHRMTWSARGASIPKTSLWSFHPVASENCAWKKKKKHRPSLLHPSFSALRNLKTPFFPLSLSSPRNNELSNKQRKDPSALSPSRGCFPVSAVAPLFYRAASPDSLEQPPAGRRRRRRREGEGVMMSGMDGGRGNTGGERERIGALINSQKR